MDKNHKIYIILAIIAIAVIFYFKTHLQKEAIIEKSSYTVGTGGVGRGSSIGTGR